MEVILAFREINLGAEFIIDMEDKKTSITNVKVRLGNWKSSEYIYIFSSLKILVVKTADSDKMVNIKKTKSNTSRAYLPTLFEGKAVGWRATQSHASLG